MAYRTHNIISNNIRGTPHTRNIEPQYNYDAQQHLRQQLLQQQKLRQQQQMREQLLKQQQLQQYQQQLQQQKMMRENNNSNNILLSTFGNEDPKIKEMRDLQRMKKLEKMANLDYSSENVKRKILDINNNSRSSDQNEKSNRAQLDKLAKMKKEDLEKQILSEQQKLYNTRTNQPYKIIITDKKYTDMFLKNPLPKSSTERNSIVKNIMIHKVTKEDKDQALIENKFNGYKKEIAVHNEDLKKLYNKENLSSHKEKFNYHHVKKYESVSYDPMGHDEMKTSHENENKEIEGQTLKDKEMVKDILGSIDVDSDKTKKKLKSEGLSRRFGRF